MLVLQNKWLETITKTIIQIEAKFSFARPIGASGSSFLQSAIRISSFKINFRLSHYTENIDYQFIRVSNCQNGESSKRQTSSIPR